MCNQPHFLMQNFVGLSVHDGYITCGSENNGVSIMFNAYICLVMLALHFVGTVKHIEFSWVEALLWSCQCYAN